VPAGLVLLPSKGDEPVIALWMVLAVIVVLPVALGLLLRLWDRRRATDHRATAAPSNQTDGLPPLKRAVVIVGLLATAFVSLLVSTPIAQVVGAFAVLMVFPIAFPRQIKDVLNSRGRL
jgi:hypothetical protein